MTSPVLSTLTVADAQLRTATWGTGAPDIVLLHDGLGSISQWRNVPCAVAARTGKTVLAYDRAGHGESLPTPSGPWPTDWLHREADVLEQVLAAVGGLRPTLVGHSDGGSIALIYAAHPVVEISGILAIAPHSWVERVCCDSIVDMRKNRAPIIGSLAKHHRHPEAVFDAWSGVWVSNNFQRWDIRPDLGTISVPTLIAQGELDAYASQNHAHLTAASIGPNAISRIVPEVGHLMHHDDAEVVIDLITELVDNLVSCPVDPWVIQLL